MARLFHTIEPTTSRTISEIDDAEMEKAVAEVHGTYALSTECRNDIRSLASRWRQLVREDARLGDAGKRLSPPELLLWMQAYDSAAPTALAEGDSATEIISRTELSHLPRFLSRLESMLRGLLHGGHTNEEKAASVAGLGPPAAITIARSPDGFAPIETIPHIEHLVIAMLDRVYAPALRDARAVPTEDLMAGNQEMITVGGLRVQYTAETAALNDLQTIEQWLLPLD